MQCYACQASVSPETRFCPECGHPVPATAPDPGTLDVFDVDEFNQLRSDKERLAGELEGKLRRPGERDSTPDERRDWAETYREWKRVANTITQIMQRFVPRRPADRRRGPTRSGDRRQSPASPPGPERRQKPDRRQADRRSGTDRRDPFRDRDPGAA